MTSLLTTALILVLCVILSFLLSGMEAGVFALNRLRVRRLARSGNSQARVLHDFIENPERFLWTILVGNTLVNFLVLGWVAAELHAHFPGRFLLNIGLFAVAVFWFYAFCDLLPKVLYRTFPNRLCLVSAGVFRWVSLILSPLVFLVEEVSLSVLRLRGSQLHSHRLFGNREELRAVMAEAAQALTTDEHAMVNRVLDLQHHTVSQLTIPLAKTVSVNSTTTLEEALQLARDKNLSRFPVWEVRAGENCVAGLLEVNGLIYRESLDLKRTAGEFMLPALFIDEAVRLEVALRRMQRSGQRMAIVLGHEQNEVGIVALEDILKLMFGEVKL